MFFDSGKGPIPGENYTSDTRNYPWHQPPEFTDVNEALDYISERIVKPKVANGIVTLAEVGIPLYKIASSMIMSGVMEGKWTPDFALLLAGPMTRIIEILCVGYGVDYNIGIDDQDEIMTGEFFKALQEPTDLGDQVAMTQSNPTQEQAPEQTQKPEEKAPDLGSSGFMSQITSGGK